MGPFLSASILRAVRLLPGDIPDDCALEASHVLEEEGGVVVRARIRVLVRVFRFWGGDDRDLVWKENAKKKKADAA